MIAVPVYRRFSDLDPLGHVNNVAYLDYLQEARMGLVGDISRVVNDEYSQVVVEQQIRHHAPLLHHPDPIVIEVRVHKLARTSYTLGYRVLDESGALAAEATTLLAVVDSTSGRPIRLPTELHEALAAHVV